MRFIQRSFVLLITVLLSGMSSLNAQTTWTGATSTDWNLASNWTGGIPDANDDVTIINVANDPVISAAGAVAKSVTIQANGLLTINAAGVLSINSNTVYGFNNSGTVQNNGTVHLGNVSGGWTTSALRNTGTFNNNAGAKINIDNVGDAGQRDALSNGTNGTFNNAGEITIGGIANGLNNSGGLYGLRSTGTFNNLQTGIIRIDKITFYAFSSSFLFTNNGQLIIGNSPIPGNNSIGRYGLGAGGTFTNSSTGKILINNYATQAISVSDHCIFDNSGSIRAGETGGTTTLMAGGIMPGVLNNKTGGVFEGTGTMIASRFANQGGTLSPGISGGSATAGWMSFDGNMDFTSNILAIDVNGKVTPGVSYDQIGVNGVATLGGTLTVSFNSFTGAAGDQVTILTSTNGLAGKFATVTGLPAGWQINYTATEVILSNGSLSTTAYNVWTGAANTSYTNLNNWSKGATPTTNDDVLIPAGTTNKPILGGTGGRAKSVTIEAGTSLTITAAGILQINGSDKQGIFNQGTLTNAGTIHIGNTSATGLYGIVNSGTITNSTGGKINIDRATVSAILASEDNINNAGTVTIGAVAATPELIKAEGTGIFNNNTGGVFKGAGTIYNSRFANAGGTISVGAPVGNITFNSSKGFNNTTLDLELNGVSGAGVDFDRIDVNGTATLGGTLNVTVNYTPSAGEEALLLSATAVTGTFTTVNLPAGWSIQYTSNSVKITYGQNYWTGTVNTSWHTAGNWTMGTVPAATDVVIIPNVTNDPVISAGAAVAKTVTVLSGGLLSINAGQTLTINGSPDQGLLNEGAVQNSGTITIGNTAAIGVHGIWNKGTFMNNPGSAINIDRIDQNQGAGIKNEISKTFTNQGTIRIGAVAGTGNNTVNTSGIYNQGLFTNSPNAKLYTDRAFNGIYNFAQNANSFTNHGEIFIGGVAAGNTLGYGIVTLYNFTNAAGAVINIDRSSTGIDIGSATSLEFVNSGTITFGKSASVPALMIIGSLGVFSNNTGGVIEGSGSISGGTFKHAGGTVIPAWSAPGITYGKLQFNTNQNIANNVLSMDLGGTSNAGVDYDQVVVTGNLTIGGALNVTAGYTAVEGDEITIISATAVTGTFATTNLPAGWTIRYTSTGVKLTFGTNDPNTWTGAVSTAWAVAGNWTKGIPVTGSNVVIPDVARDPVISTTTAVARTVWVQTGAVLTINAAASLTLNGTAPQNILNEGTVQNNGSLYIGITAANVTNAIYNLGSFNNNTAAAITINKAAENTDAAIVNATGTFTNKGNISIGTGGNAGKYGIINGASFENNAGAAITIGSITNTAIQNNNGTFNNAGNIHYGISAGAANYGIDNAAVFNNNAGGVVGIDRTATVAVFNSSGSFSNTGIIKIGAIAASGTGGIYNTTVFNNNTGGELRIDRVSTTGISTSGSGSFSNAGNIYIGEEAGGTSFATGIQQASAFSNTGTIRINQVTTAITTVGNTFTNTGLIDAGALTTVTNLIGFGAGGFSHAANSELRGAGNISASRFSTVDGKLSPGNPIGIMRFDGNEDFNRTIFNMDVNTNSPGTGFDQVISTGRIDISSGTTLNLNISYTGVQGDQLTIMTGSSLVGTFSTVNGLPAGWAITYTATSVILKYTSGSTWTGAVNTEWANAGNWTGGIPIANSFVTIPDVSNDPVLNSATATLGNIIINAGAQLTIGATGILNVNGNGTENILNEGTLTNNGNITIGNVAAAGQYGIYNSGTFTNASNATINIARVTEAYIHNNNGTFTNNGTINAGTVFNSNSKYGLYNNAIFQNAGTLNIENITNVSLNHIAQTFTNTGTINIGVSASSGSDGINTAAAFTNETSGRIYIDRNTSVGIYQHGAAFTNKGLISINALNIGGYTTSWGIYIDQPFNNTGGQIIINRVTAGIAVNAQAFTNAGTVTIGNLVAVSTLISNQGNGTFSNSTNGELKGTGVVDALRFVNAGGKLSPGYTTAGVFTFSGNEGFNTAIANIKVNGTGTAGTNFDRIVVNGTAGITGATLNLDINYTPAVGDRITILTATTLTGTFTTVTGLPSNWSVKYENNSVILVAEGEVISAATTWTGAVSSAWAVAGNWTAGVPGAITDVTIPDVTNDPVISTTTAVAKSIVVNSGAILTIENGAILTLNNAGTQGLRNLGTVQNSGTINIGNTATTGSYGLRNEGSFDNRSTGKLYIDRSTSIGLYNYAGSFTNAGLISVGGNAAVGGTGFQNRAAFSNNTGGALNIDRATTIAIYNEINTITNTGTINVGAIAATGADGIDNYGTLNNDAGGQIYVNRVTSAGIYSSGVDFVNKGLISIGNLNTGTSISHGIYFDGQFENATGGSINIDRVNSALTVAQNSLYNRSVITIGAAGNVPVLVAAAAGTGMMYNESGAELRGTGTIAAAKFENNSGVLMPGNESAGKMIFNASESFVNSTTKIQVNDKGTGGVNFDQIDVQGTATLSGVLALSVNYTGVNGDQISILTATAVTGTYTSITGLPANWKVVYKTNAVVLEYDDHCYWTGNVSTAWNTAGNWTPKVAGVSNSVVLASSGVTRELSVNIGAMVSAVQVETGRTLTITSAGTLTVSNTFTNNGTIKGAGRIVNSNFTNAGTIAPGMSPGILSITGNFSNQGTIQAELGGATVGTQYDRLAVSGTVTLGGNLVISTINGFKPVVGQTYTIITGSSVTGSFASVTWPGGITGTVTNTATGVNLNIVSVLPLTLLEFTGQSMNDKALLKWKTAEEVNTSHFSIERSTDGQRYAVIGNVTATGAGAGNYSFTDANTVNGNNYYRLKMIDIDGAFKYSPVVIVKFASKNEVKISPVPASSYVIFTISDRSLVGKSAQVFSPAGNLVASLVLALSNRIEIAHLPSGIYTIKTSSGTYRFIKQ